MKYLSLLFCITLSCKIPDSEVNWNFSPQVDTITLHGKDSGFNSFFSTADSINRGRSELPIIKKEDSLCDSLKNAGLCSKVKIFGPLKLQDSTTGKYLRPYCLQIDNPKFEPDSLEAESKKLAKLFNESIIVKYA